MLGRLMSAPGTALPRSLRVTVTVAVPPTGPRFGSTSTLSSTGDGAFGGFTNWWLLSKLGATDPEPPDDPLLGRELGVGVGGGGVTVNCSVLLALPAALTTTSG